MTTKFLMTRDIAGYNGFGLTFSDTNYRTTLAADVEQNFTVPTAYQNWIAIFTYSPGTTVWVDNNNTATAAGASFAATTCQGNPAARKVHGGDVLSFITSDTESIVGVSLYAIY